MPISEDEKMPDEVVRAIAILAAGCLMSGALSKAGSVIHLREAAEFAVTFAKLFETYIKTGQ